MGIFDGLWRDVTESSEIDWNLMLDLDFSEDTSMRSYLKVMAVDTVLNFVGRTMSTVKIGVDNKDWDYIMNVKPNSNDSASSFWQKFFYKLMAKNEVLVIFTDDNQLLIADSYFRNEYAVFDDTFSSVTVKNYTFQRTFRMSEVVFLEYNNDKLSKFTKGLFDDSGELYGRILEVAMRNNQIRASVGIDSTGTLKDDKDAGGRTRTEKLQGFIDKVYNSYRTNSVAIVPKMKGFEYEEYTNKQGVSNQSLEELTKMATSLIDDIANMIGVPTALIYGEKSEMDSNTKAYKKLCITPLMEKLKDELTVKILTKREYFDGQRIKVFPIGQKYSVYIKAYSLESSLNIKIGSADGSQAVTVTNNGNIPKTYKVEGLVRGASHTLSIMGELKTTLGTLFISEIKLEQGSVVTPYMPSASEVTTTDWPSYRGEYSDFSPTSSTDPLKYSWGVTRGNDGVGIKTTDITYAISTSGTTAPSTGWTSSVPTLVKGQYLWTKTVWTYTDNSSKTGYSVTYISKDGTNGTNGTSGIIVSSVAPASPQNGQLWQDTSTTPQLVKKWTGSSWVIWEFYAQNLKADNISVISLNLGDMTGGTVKLTDDVDVNGTLKKHGLYQSKMGLLSSGPSLATPSTLSNSQMGVANLNRGELRFIVTDYTEDLKNVQETGMSDPNTAFIQFNSYDSGKDVMLIGSSGDIVFKGITSQDTPWIAMGNGAYYKNMFSRVYISYSIQATSTANIPLGVLPVGLRPFRGLHLAANAWGTTLINDRHIEVKTTGEVTLYNPANGASYDGEVSFTI